MFPGHGHPANDLLKLHHLSPLMPNYHVYVTFKLYSSNFANAEIKLFG